MKRQEPKIVSKNEFMVIGMQYIGKNEHGEITKMWQEFMPRLKEIKNLTLDKESGDACYGLCYMPKGTEKGVIEYIACFPVSSLEHIPVGMIGRIVPPQTYAVTEAYGVKDIGEAYNFLINEWMPLSGYKAGEGPDFELYTKNFNPEDPESVFYVYFPVKK